jgi:uncharacterized protein YcaQ
MRRRPSSATTLDVLRRYAVARTFFSETTLRRAIAKLGFVQADPIRAPARAQDLTLRHRVKGYRAGDLERAYPTLDLEEGFFINYGFLPRHDYLLMQPRTVDLGWSDATTRRSRAIVRFIDDRGAARPREVEAAFGHGKTTNYWGRLSNATTHLLDQMHYRGLLRVLRRDAGTRVYAVQPRPTERRRPAQHLDALIDVFVRTYAPLPAPSLAWLVSRLRYATPQWKTFLKPALRRAKARLAHATIDGVGWYGPASESPARHADEQERVRLLSPFDPLTWDRRRFELFWEWAYRFEAYTPAAKRKLGYYALPLLWRDRIVGWANAARAGNRLECQVGFVADRPRETAFERELEAEIARLEAFL